MEKIEKEKSMKVILDKSIKFLSIRDYGEYELFLKLKKTYKNKEKLILEVIKKLKDLDLLNEKRYVESIVESKIEKYSLNYIKNYLRNKGVDTDLYEDIFDKYKNREIETIQKIIAKKKKFGRKEIMTYLKNKGFTYNQISEVLK